MQTEKTINICDYCKSETNHKCWVCWKDVCTHHLWKNWMVNFTWYEYWYSERVKVCSKCMDWAACDNESLYELRNIAYEADILSKELVTSTFYKWIKEKNDSKFSRKKFMNDLFKAKTLL